MTATAHALFAADASLMAIAAVMVALFSAVIVTMMRHDYRFYMASHRKKRRSLADFLRCEQFYIYLLLFFFLLMAGEVWRHGTR